MDGPSTPRTLRVANRERLLDLLRAQGPTAQADLARASGLSPATVSSIAGDLRAEGWLEGDGGGRGERLVLSRSAGFAVGVDFGHSHVRVALADLAHTVVAETDAPLQTDGAAAAGIALAGRLVDELLERSGADRGRLVGAGMGLPGPLRADSGEVGDSAILPGWIGARPQALLEAALAMPVLVDNDANLGALAETTWGDVRGSRDVLYVKAATGIGAGLVLDGRLHHGATGTAGELGHVPVDDAGAICRCGNRGCLETVAGADAILAPLRGRPLRPSVASTSSDAPEPTFTLDGGLTLRAVVDAAVAGDRACARVIEDAGRALGRGVAGACNLLGPERVVVGGELARAGEALLEPLRDGLRRAAIGAVREVPVSAGVLGERAEVLGALALVLRSPARQAAAPAVA